MNSFPLVRTLRTYLAAASLLSVTVATAASLPEIPPEFADAPAVVLEHEVEWNVWLGKSTTRVRKRVLVLDEAGNDHADQSVSYSKPGSELREFSARTIQPDGSVVPVPAELRHDLVAYRSGDREVRVVQFTFPAVRVGSILEWEYELRFDDRKYFEWWDVQESIPVLRTALKIQFRSFPAVPIRVGPSARIPFAQWCDKNRSEPTLTSMDRVYVCRNVPAFERELLSPPESESRLRLLMSWWPAGEAGMNVTLWNAIGERWHDRIERLSRKDGNVGALVAEWRDAVESEAEMVDRAYDWVRENLSVRDLALEEDLEKDRGESRSVAEILERGGGTPNEVAIATLVLLHAAGIEVRPVLVGDRSRERLDWGFPDPPSDLHMLLEVITDGKIGFLDPGCELCSPGIPDWRYCAGPDSGIRVDLASRRVTPADVPPVRSLLNSERYRDEIRLGVDGTGAVAGSVRWFGQHDVSVRRGWADLTPSRRQDSLRRRVAGDIEDFEVRLSDPLEFRETLLAEYTYKRRDMAMIVDDRMLIAPPDVFTPGLALPMQEERNLPIWWVYPYSIVQEVIFTLPEGFEIRSLPEPTRLAGPGLKYQDKWVEEEDGRLRWEAILMYERISLARAEYPEARRFATELFRALRGGIVVRRVGAAVMEVGSR